MTFFISAIIHELIITYALGFFYPILFILFTGPGNIDFIF
jgi:sterol O-acyltransferase